ncbi:LPS export ABC transporter permease LptF [Limnohabitans sp. Rim8]|uniref:LPS export ABC transporter permease LptF n=1 Tax=Limnohabitans sp. Rim8 TaxID=1100718 RepID=UPI00260DF157|nr:LPS export ABC transporter permease LptF [Limnohabitans sp. Rim8]
MLFHSSLRKDLARNFGATLLILVTIVMTIILIRTLGQASRGSVNPSEVLLVMGFSVLGQMTTIITLSLFISSVATLSRMYGESEMVIWFASGQGVGQFIRPLFRFSWPIFVVIGLLSLFVWPWSHQQIQDLRQRYEKRNDVERIAPGQFQESAGGNRVFFIDKDSPGQEWGTNVFVSSRDGQLESVTTASQGRIEFVGLDRFLFLEKGQQWLTHLDTGETRLTQFERYQLLIDSDTSPVSSVRNSRQSTTLQLIQQPTSNNQAELAWRVGLVFTAINMVLLALALSAVNPRVGRSYHLGLALFVFVAYYNLLNVGQSWISTGRMGAMPFVLGLHGGVLAVSLVWLAWRHMNWSWRNWLPSIRQTQGAPA